MCAANQNLILNLNLDSCEGSIRTPSSWRIMAKSLFIEKNPAPALWIESRKKLLALPVLHVSTQNISILAKDFKAMVVASKPSTSPIPFNTFLCLAFWLILVWSCLDMKLKRDNSQWRVKTHLMCTYFCDIQHGRGGNNWDGKGQQQSTAEVHIPFYLQCFSVFIYSHLGGQCCVDKNDLAQMTAKLAIDIQDDSFWGDTF